MPTLPPPTIIRSVGKLEEMAELFMKQPIVAVDTESNSLYAYYERICLIQFSVSGGDYIVDPLGGLDMSPLGPIFASSEIQKIFHAAEQDVGGLKRDFDFQVNNLFDTMWAARILGWPRVGLANLLEEHFDIHTNKRYQRYNWGKRPLDPEALTYARLDTHYLLQLRALEVEELEALGRCEEAAEVFAQIAETEASELPFGPHAFWRVKGLHDLADREQAIAWELYLWRDQEASRRNRPPFKVMGDRTLTALARRRPRSFDDMEGIRGVSSYILRRYGETILSAVKRGLQGPIPKHPPSDPRPREDVLTRHRKLRSWRRRVARKRKVDGDVVLSNATLWELAQRNPRSMKELEGIEGLGPWKRRTYGPGILKVLR